MLFNFGSNKYGTIETSYSSTWGTTFLCFNATNALLFNAVNDIHIDSTSVAINADNLFLDSNVTLYGKFTAGDSYIQNGEGYFYKLNAVNLYENGTALSNKYLSNSQLKSCLVTDSNSKSISCSSNGGTGSTTVSMTKNGYTLLGCVGIEVSGTASTLCNIVEFSVSGSGIYVRYRNMHETSSSQTDTWTLTTYGLYIKN